MSVLSLDDDVSSLIDSVSNLLFIYFRFEITYTGLQSLSPPPRCSKATFVGIHIIGIDAGILFGVVVAVIDYVFTTAQVTTVTRVIKRSRAVWTPADYKLLQDNAYGRVAKIVTFEIRGSVFFGSSIQLLQNISEDIGLDATQEEAQELTIASPAPRGHPRLMKNPSFTSSTSVQPNIRRRPCFLVLNLSHLSNLDASATRGCFLQLAKMCAKRGIVVCASGALPRVEWMLRSHDTAHTIEEEEKVKQSLLDTESGVKSTEKILLFLTLYEGLEFCENLMINQMTQKATATRRPSFIRLDELVGPADATGADVPKETLPHIFAHVLGLHDSDLSQLSVLEKDEFHEEKVFSEGDVIFRRDTTADAFFIVLKGAVALVREDYIKQNTSSTIISGAGHVQMSQSPLRMAKEIGDIRAILQTGTIFGFVDFLLDRPRTFGAISSQGGTVCAMITHARLDQLEATNPDVHAIFQKVLLSSSVMELANCTCSE